MTVYDNKKASLWNVDTAEQLHTFNFKSKIVVSYYEKETNKLICFFENNNEIHILNLAKLGLFDTYINDDLIAAQKKSDDHAVKIFSLDLFGKKHYYILMNKGNLFDYSYTEKEYSILLDKVIIFIYF